MPCIAQDGKLALDGVKPVVVDGHTADWVLVAARMQQGLGTFLVEKPGERGLSEGVPFWDGTRKLACLDRRGVEAQPVGLEGDHTAIWRRIVDDGRVALYAELIGLMEQAHHLAVDTPKCAWSSTGRSPRYR